MTQLVGKNFSSVVSPRCLSVTNLTVGCLLSINWDDNNKFLYFRAYFRKIKHSGIRRFVKKCPFWKKNFFKIWIKSLRNNFQFGGIRPAPALLDNLSFLLSNKEPFDWIELNLIDFSILPKQSLNFHLFCLRYFYTYFNEVYAIYKIVDCENMKLNRNGHSAVRKSLLRNTCWLRIKTFTNQTSTF